ncbi:3'(2'),5'-bisphosphate nucleotidase CysQ [Sphingosinicella rhizophila]|uniref:3'(2'),5'-bisphosphate nucleotidase CysQ n=1 Tax=Sphingosinicella rhizophila TaxID=3050082 RepID=A0ABU3QCB9_9SPHN|nr:3'(2'),5'-bisphosphate nucleotidase CysQ [Sphingosinicella sp. GR2756]MDT9600799.1 3'(2'),5'-bisphosphate nucleotidase CysQ [Sphingosinicella sp. GR2756]
MTNPLLATMIEAALEAGAEIERIYEAGCATETKEDGSPVTEADRRAEQIILDRLRKAFPDVPILAEEEVSEGRIPAVGMRFFCVDPLDGTRGFVQRNGEFTVNIALIEDEETRAGVVYAPDSHLLYYGAAGEGAFRVRDGGPPEPIRTRLHPSHGLTAIGSRNHGSKDDDGKNAGLNIVDYLPSGSSLKFCMVAEGSADVYPRHGRTMEWDTAAGQAVLEAAGGRVMALDGIVEAGPLRYGKVERGFDNPHFIAWGQ